MGFELTNSKVKCARNVSPALVDPTILSGFGIIVEIADTWCLQTHIVSWLVCATESALSLLNPHCFSKPAKV